MKRPHVSRARIGVCLALIACALAGGVFGAPSAAALFSSVAPFDGPSVSAGKLGLSIDPGFTWEYSAQPDASADEDGPAWSVHVTGDQDDIDQVLMAGAWSSLRVTYTGTAVLEGDNMYGIVTLTPLGQGHGTPDSLLYLLDIDGNDVGTCTPTDPLGVSSDTLSSGAHLISVSVTVTGDQLQHDWEPEIVATTGDSEEFQHWFNLTLDQVRAP
ncbi:MAG: hypothetical protein LBR32_05680 [Propionibacteriaceae bacterium]|jgi:hypothetical protein|nr:hypothetical protein [Propionibacteriaceae bacterium]